MRLTYSVVQCAEGRKEQRHSNEEAGNQTEYLNMELLLVQLTGISPNWARRYLGSMLVMKVISPTNVCMQKELMLET